MLLRIFYILCAAMSLSACSPGMFFGGDPKGDLDNIPPYREQNPVCSNIHLDHATMDVPSFRAVLDCFNSNGALGPVAESLHDLSDEDVLPIVEVGNRHLLSSSRMIYHLDQAYSSLDRQHLLEPLFDGVSKMLSNDELMASGAELMLQILNKESGWIFKTVEPDDLALQALSILASEFTTVNVEKGFNAGLSVADAPAFQGFETRFRGPSPGRRTLEEISEKITQFLTESSNNPDSNLGSLILSAVSSGGLFYVQDGMMGTTEDQIRANTLSFTPTITVPLQGGGVLLDRISSLFHYMNRPISCMLGTRVVPNGIRHAIRELAEFVPVEEAGDYIQRQSLLTLVAMNPFCDYPTQLGQHYQALASVAQTSAMVPMSRLTKRLWSFQDRIGTPSDSPTDNRPMIDLLISILSLRGPNGATGINLLIPALAELSDRGAWEEIMLMTAIPTNADRQLFQRAARFLLQTRPELRGKSLAQVFGDLASRIKPETLEKFLAAMGTSFETNGPVLLPALQGLRNAYFANDTHPIVELVGEILRGAPGTPNLYKSLYKMAQKPSFAKSIKWVSRMAQEGSLKSIFGGLATLFRRFSLTGRDRDILDTQIPPFQLSVRHRLAKENLLPPINQPPPVLAIPACQRLNFTIRLDEVNAPGYDDFLNDLTGCLGSNGRHDALLASIAFLRAQHTEDGRSFFQLPILATQDLSNRLGIGGVRDIADRFTAMVNDRRLFRLVDSLPYFTMRPFLGGPLLDPLLRLVGRLESGDRAGMQAASTIGANLMVREEVPHLVKFAETLYDQPDPPIGPANPVSFDINRIKRWVYNKECTNNPTPGRRNAQWELNRANEVADEYLETVTGWDLVQGRPRRSFRWDEFIGEARPIVQKLMDPAQSAPGAPALEALLGVMKQFTTDFTPEQLYAWAYEKSNDVRLSTYFYPEDDKPRVRLMSTLDLMDSVLIDADFTYLEHFTPDNSGMKHQIAVAKAWGDEPRSRWPEEIQRAYPPGHRPQTLAEAVDDMAEELDSNLGLAGTPGLPGCMANQIADPNDDPATQRRETTDPDRNGWLGFLIDTWVKRHLYNLVNALPVLRENLPDAAHPEKIGMKILRNIFWEFLKSTPMDYRDARSGDHNNLSLVSKMVRLGMVRNVSRKLYRAPFDSSGFRELFRALAIGGANPATPALLREFFRPESNPLWEQAIREVFAIVSAPNGEFLTKSEVRQWLAVENRESFRTQLQNLLNRLDLENRDPNLAERNALRLLLTSANDAQRALIARWRVEADRLREFIFYAVAGLGQADQVDEARNGGEHRGELISQSVAFLRTFAVTERPALKALLGDFRSFVEKPTMHSVMKKIFLSDLTDQKARIARLTREVILSDQASLVPAVRLISPFFANEGNSDHRRDWNEFNDRWDAMRADPGYQALNVDPVLRDLVHFFEEGPEPGDQDTSARVRLFMAGLMDPRYSPRTPQPRQGDVDQWLELLVRDPEGVKSMIRLLGNYAQNGDLRWLIDLTQRSITPPTP